MTKSATFLLASLVAVAACSVSAQAGMVTVTRTNTDDIVIPVFNQSLGTLNGVNLSVTLRSGVTAPEGGHDHGSYQIFSSNIVTNPSVGSFGTMVMSSTSPPHSHFAPTPVYFGGGLFLGDFGMLPTAPEPGHSHQVLVTYNGLVQVGFSDFRAAAVVDTIPGGATALSYMGVTRNYGYGGASVAPFLAPGDIVIGGGIFVTLPSAPHDHFLPAFSATAPAGFFPGFWSWNFAASAMPPGSGHSHLIDPRFDVVAQFFYTEPVGEVPEPSTLVLALTALGAVGARRHAGRWRRTAG